MLRHEPYFRSMGMNIPPSIQRANRKLMVVALACLAPTVLMIFHHDRLGSFAKYVGAVSFLTILPAIIILRMRTLDIHQRMKAYPGGLCWRCEHPLPDDAARPEMAPMLVCTECGLVSTRREHEKVWRRWVDLPFEPR